MAILVIKMVKRLKITAEFNKALLNLTKAVYCIANVLKDLLSNENVDSIRVYNTIHKVVKLKNLMAGVNRDGNKMIIRKVYYKSNFLPNKLSKFKLIK
jgi:hypothetical protein